MRRARTLFTSAPLVVAALALAGMAYCHIVDVQMKFDEHVYYMAYLFLGNIALSVLLIPALGYAFLNGSERLIRAVWAAAGGLAVATIAGFLWSRTIGFPQMADHIGEWDRLGLESLVFEGTIVLLSVRALFRPRVPRAATAAGVVTLLALGLMASSASAHGMKPMTMLGNPSPYPPVSKATPHQRRVATSLWHRTQANAPRFGTVADARANGYEFNPREDVTIGFPGLRHMRLHDDNHFSGRLLDPTAPQSLVYWCTAPDACTLTAFMYRAPANSRPPTYGPLLAWHKHSAKGTWMTHVWLTRTLRSALARCAPWPFLEKALGIHELPWHEDVDADMACPAPHHKGM